MSTQIKRYTITVGDRQVPLLSDEPEDRVIGAIERVQGLLHSQSHEHDHVKQLLLIALKLSAIIHDLEASQLTLARKIQTLASLLESHQVS